MRRIQVVTAACAALMWTAAAGVPMAAAQGPGSGGGSAQGSTQGGSSTGATAGTSGMGDRDAQTGAEAASTPQASSNSGNDLQQFVEKAAIANLAEIELGKLATQQAQDPQVKQFAQMMVDEHTSALEQLRSAASSQGLQVASSLDSKHQKLQQKLSKLQGAEFDRAYMDAMVDAHKDAEKLLKRRAGNTNSASASNTGHNQGTSAAEGTSSPSGSGSGTSAMGTSSTAGSGTPATTGTSGSTSGSTETGPPSVGTPGTTATTGTSGTSSTSTGSTGATGSSASMTAPTSADQWAAMTLPKVRAHLEQARSLEDQVKKSGKSNDGDNSGAGNTGAGDSRPSGSGAGNTGSTPPQQ